MTYLSIKPPADLWKTVRATTVFPILEETRQRIRSKMQSQRVSFDELAPSIERDPAMCLNLLLLAARQRPESVAQISGAASCLSLLGMQDLVRLVKQLPVVESTTDDPQQIAYRRALLTAQFAGNLAASWAQIKGRPSVSYARWSTMLSQAPLWPWLLNWPAAANWMHLLTRHVDLKTAAERVFGKADKQWALLFRELQLPVMAQDMYAVSHLPDAAQWQTLRRHDPRDLDNQRPLLHLCQDPAMICLMAGQMAWHLHIAPQHHRCSRWLMLVSHWLGRPPFQTGAQIRQIQVQTSQQQHSSQGTGLHLLLSPNPAYEPYPWIAPDTATADDPLSQPAARPQIADPQRHSDERYMKNLLAQLRERPDSFGDWHYLMRGMLRGMTEGIGMPSACVALLNKDKTLLKVVYAEGMSEQSPMRRFSIDLRQTSLFTRLLEKQASVLLTPDNRERFLSQLPADMAARLPQQTMMMSIDAGASPIGIAMAFAGEQQDALSNAEYITFKNLCMVSSQSLATLRTRTVKAAGN